MAIGMAMLLTITAPVGIVESAKAVPSRIAMRAGSAPFQKQFATATRRDDVVAAQAITRKGR